MKLFLHLALLIPLSLFADSLDVPPANDQPAPWIGLAVYEDPDDVSIAFIFPDSPAAKAGLRPEDELISIEGHKIVSARDLITAVHKHQPGDIIEVKYRRNDTVASVKVTLAEGTPDDIEEILLSSGDGSGNGERVQLDMQNLTAEDADFVWQMITQENATMLTELGFTQEHAQRIVAAMQPAKAQLMKP